MTSNLIKARTLQSSGQPVVVRRSTQIAAKQGDDIVAEARTEASRIIAEAQQKALGILAAAKQEGYEQGVGEWHGALTAAWKKRDEYMEANEESLLKLAVKIAEKLIGEELKIAPEAIANIAREALRSVRRAKTFVVQVHPADAALLDQRLPTLRSAIGPTREIEVVSNPALKRGDCVIESDIGVIDARLETQLKNIERTLTARISS